MSKTTDATHTPGSYYERFFSESLCGFAVADSQGKLKHVNARLAEWAAASITELEGKRFSDLLNFGGKIYYETHLAPMLRMQGFFEEVLLEMNAANGTKLRLLVNAKESRSSNGGLEGIHFTLIKAADRLQYEKNLQLEKQMAEQELTRQKELVAFREQLIAVMGHDLRNPLSAVSLVAEMLPFTKNENERATMVATLQRSSFRMKELVANIMDFARTRMGEGIVLSTEEVVLTPILQTVIDEIKIVYPLRDIVTDFKQDHPIICDPNRIAQLVSNLLANAITHGLSDRPVVVKSFFEGNAFKISVANSGNPIPASMQAQIFDPYTKQSKRSSVNGLGLGLFISAEIAKAHDAELNFISDEMETVFTLSLRLMDL